jgi:RNA polymerase sigma factor (sigma-70 family)
MQPDLYQLLLNNSDTAYKEIYKGHYAAVRLFVLKNGGSDDDVKDLFQESIIALWDNVHSGKYKHSNEAMLHGYFRRICKFKWMETIRGQGKMITLADDERLDPASDETILDQLVKRDEINELDCIFKVLSDKCREILSLFYYEKKNMKEISGLTGYELVSMRNEKYKCIEKLKGLYLRKSPSK